MCTVEGLRDWYRFVDVGLCMHCRGIAGLVSVCGCRPVYAL